MMRHVHTNPLGLLTIFAMTLLLGITGCPPPDGGGNSNGDGDGGGGPATFSVPTRSTSIALTSNDRVLLVANRDANTVSVIEVLDENGADTANLLAEMGVGIEPRYVAISPDDATGFVSNTVSGTVSVLSLSGADAFTVVAEIGVGTEPRGIALTPNGSLLYVANHTAGTVAVIDTQNRSVVNTIALGGNPAAIAITNDGDEDDTDETVFVTQFFAELVPNGPGEAFDDGKQGVVQAFPVANPANISRIVLSPLLDVGFNADRSLFCQQINASAVNNTFCPNTRISEATNPVLAEDPQGAFPNQLASALLRGSQLFLPNIGAGPEPPLRFNVNVQALVHVVNTATLQEAANQSVNLNTQISGETQPVNPTASLARLFGNDLVAIDADEAGSVFLIVSRGGNFVFRAGLDANGALTLNAPNVVRFQTGNLPTGVVINSAGTRAYTNNEVGRSVSVLNLENNTTSALDVPSSTPPAPGTFEHGVALGKLAFFTALGVPDNGIFSQEIRDIIPLQNRGKQSDNAWSSCGSCHPDGLSDRVTWIFATGPRQTVPLDAFFAKDNPRDQKISNWSAVRSSVTDFNQNSINVQGGSGFAGTPPNPAIFNHGIDQGASDALDAQTLWVQTVRPPILPQASNTAAAVRGLAVFQTNCASCHGGPKWTKSQVIYLHNPVFEDPPVAGSIPRDPNLINAAAQLVRYEDQQSGLAINLIEDVGTFSAANAIEIRNDATGALGALGFNVPSLLGVAYHAPYFHDGSAATLNDVFARHGLADTVVPLPSINLVFSAAQQSDLLVFLNSIDGSTPFLRSEMDEFRDAVATTSPAP